MRRAGLAVAAILLVVLTGCSGKYSEPFKDAPRGSSNDGPADTFTMPDGFGNGATKCIEPGIRAGTLFHSDGAYGSLALIADPNCK